MSFLNDAVLEGALQLIERGFSSKFSDGLPVVPPTAERISEFVAATGLDADLALGALAPSLREVTIADVALCGVLAGCRSAYAPVLVAAARALADESLDLYGLACSTKGSAPLLIVNGPVRHEIDVNCQGNVFGAGWRANATIGRAVRLMILRIAGAVPNELDRATLGHPGRFAYCIGEDEENSPWEPLHVERGLNGERSALTVFGGEAVRQVNMHYDSADAVLAAVADTIASVGIYNAHNITGRSGHVVVFAKEHRDMLAAAGYDKARIKRRIAELAVLEPERLARVGTEVSEPLAVIESPDDLLVVAAGGIAGRWAGVVTGWSWQSQPVTVEIQP